MQAEHKSNTNEAADADGGSAPKRQQSVIEFPYSDLNAAIEVAKAVQTIGGQSCDGDQLAGYWKITPTGGAFRARYAPARTFGLLTLERSRFTLTQLGMRIVDRTQEAAARVEAFLNVSLYRAIYEKYKNYQLPGPQALQREMINLGVSDKQVDKARQVFKRAAQQAGFHWAGEDRLVKPNTSGASSAPPETLAHEVADNPAVVTPRAEQQPAKGGGGGVGGSHHLLIQGLLQTMPEPNTVWAIEGRAAWLEAAANIFKLIYQGDGRITVRAEPEKSNGAAH